MTAEPLADDEPSLPGHRFASWGEGSAREKDDDGTRDAVETLEHVLEAVAALSHTDWHRVDGARMHRALDVAEQLDRRLAALRADLLTTIDTNGLWALDGQRTFAAWLRGRTATTRSGASRDVRTSRALRDHLPRTAQALAAGTISTEHVAVLVRQAITTSRLRAQLTDQDLGEAFLVEQAQQMDATSFAKVVAAWAIAADPQAADDAYREDTGKAELHLSPTLDGYHLTGWFDSLSGQVVDKALRAHMGRKTKNDDRTPAQRRAAALTSLAHQSLDEGHQGTHARIRPHVTVTVRWETLQALAAASGSPVPPRAPTGQSHTPGAAFGFYPEATWHAPGGPRSTDSTGARDTSRREPLTLSPEARTWMQQWQPGEDHVIAGAIDPDAMTGIQPATLEDGTPIPPAVLARLTCDSALTRVIFGPDSTVLDVGREQRIFPTNMVRAIHARDRHCQYPDCDEPPGNGEIHHSLQWYRDHGPTSVEHGILLCWHHHDLVHANAVTITRSNSRWRFYHRNGWLIEPTRST